MCPPLLWCCWLDIRMDAQHRSSMHNCTLRIPKICGKTALEHYEPVWTMIQRMEATRWTPRFTWMRTIKQDVQQFNMGLHSAYHLTRIAGRNSYAQLMGRMMTMTKYLEMPELLQINVDVAVIVVTCQPGSARLVTCEAFASKRRGTPTVWVVLYSTVHIPQTWSGWW